MIDQPDTRRAQPLELCVDIGHLIGDMVKSRTVLLQKAANCRVWTKRRQHLDVAVADIEQDTLHSLVGDGFPMCDRESERVTVVREGAIDVVDRDTDVIDAFKHPVRITGA